MFIKLAMSGNKCEKHPLYINEPAHEIMALIALRKLNLQTRMRNNSLGATRLFFVRPFVYFQALCVRIAKFLAAQSRRSLRRSHMR